MVSPLEGGPFVAGRLFEVLLVGVHVIQGLGRREFILHDRDLAHGQTAAIRLPPFGQGHLPISDFARFEPILFRSHSTAARSETACLFREAALLYRELRQVEVAAGLPGGSDEYARCGGIGPFQRFEPKLGCRIGML